MSEKLSLEALARAKGLSVDILRAFGISDLPQGGVRIQYVFPNGTPARARHRLAMGGQLGSVWESSVLPITAYWNPCVSELGRMRATVLLCEGESSCWTAWHGGFGAVGIPGAEEVDVLEADHLAGANTTVVVLEPDDRETYPRGRDHYAERICSRLGAIDYTGNIRFLKLENISDDLNAFYRKKPDSFSTRLEDLLSHCLESKC